MSRDSTRKRSAKLDAPSNLQYRHMKVDVNMNLEGEFREECLFVLVSMGELGLRAGEVAHLRLDWIDMANKLIRIPRYDNCDHGEEGNICGYCRAQASLAVENGTHETLDEALENRWEPKIEESARIVPYGWSEEIVRIYDRFFRTRDRFDKSRVAVNRRVNRIARATDIIEEDEIYPHALRAHAAILHARNGVGAYALADFMGWGGPGGALPYIKLASKDVEAAFDEAHGKRPNITG